MYTAGFPEPDGRFDERFLVARPTHFFVRILMADRGDVCSHDHDCGGEDCGGSSLHGYVNHPRVSALNAQEDEAAARVIRPWDERTQTLAGDPLRSDDGDPELIVHVPFVSDVKVRGLMIIGGGGGKAPSSVKVWVNKAAGDVSFDNASRRTPTQSFDLAEDLRGELEYQTDFTQFQAVSSLTLFFPSNHNGDGTTEISFLGFRGEGTGNRRDMIVTAVYEARPMAEDHRTPAEDGAPAAIL